MLITSKRHFAGEPITSIIHDASKGEEKFGAIFATILSVSTLLIFFVIDYTRWYDPRDYETKKNFLKWLRQNKATMKNAGKRPATFSVGTIYTLEDGTTIHYNPTEEIKWSIHFPRSHKYECVIYNKLSLFERILCKKILKELDNIVA